MDLDPVTIFLLALAAIFLIGTLGEIVFQKTSIPDVIWLIVAGIALGPIGGVLQREELSAIAPYFAAITLVVVLFEGGSSLKLGEISKAAPRSTLLGLAAFVFSIIACTLVTQLAAFIGWLPESWSWTHGMLTGAILGGTSSVVIMPAMAKAKLPPALSNIINLESALTDAFCVVTTAAIIDVMTKDASEAASPAVALLQSFGIGLAVGGVAGVLWLLFLRFLKSNEHAYPITLAVLLILYVIIDRMGGSAALGILTTAVILGNASSLSTKIGLAEPAELDKDVRGFHGQMAFMIKSFFFVFIGAMLGPPWSLILVGVVLGVMLLSARVPSVYGATLGTDFTEAEKKMMVVTMPRGMAAGVLATLPVSAGVVGTEGLPVVVFACVFTTIMAFAVGFPIVKKTIPPVEPALVVDAPAPATPAAITPTLDPASQPSPPLAPLTLASPTMASPELPPPELALGSPPEPSPAHPAEVPAYLPGAFDAYHHPVELPDPPSGPGILSPPGRGPDDSTTG